MQLNKSIKIFINYFFAPLLFLWLAFSIYRHIRNQPQLQASWIQIKASFQSVQILYLVFALLLVFANWGLEARKWQISVATIQRIRFLQAFKAVLSGVTFSVSMPNRVGEYLGRVLYLPEGSRLKTISVTLVGSCAQLLTTLFWGMIGLLVLKKRLIAIYPGVRPWYDGMLYGLPVIVLVTGLLYFNVAGTVQSLKKWIRNDTFMYLVDAVSGLHKKLLLDILMLSFFRYGIFIMQYILIYYLFEVPVSGIIIAWVMSVLFLAMAIVPSIALVEIGVRGQLSLQLMGVFSSNSLGIGLASITVWFINLILPAIAGSMLLLNIKIFKKRAGEAG